MLEDKALAFQSSSYSLHSNFTSSTVTSNSASSGSTIPGPGALSGKAILALGKITLRGAERIIIRRRLNVITSRFPLEDSANVKGIERLYDDLLELSRRDLYSNDIRNQVMPVLLAQIAMRQTGHIIKCLHDWPHNETEIFLSDLMNILDPIRLLDPEAGSSPVKAYQRALAPWEGHSLVPLVDFCDQLARSFQDNATLITSFQLGVLNFLLHSYVTAFVDPLAKNERLSIHRTSILCNSCNSLLSTLCDTKQGLAIILNHPIHTLWFTRPLLPFTVPLGLDRIKARALTWSSLSRAAIILRIYSIFHVVLDRAEVDESVMYDVCADLLELSVRVSLHSRVGNLIKTLGFSAENMDLEINICALRTLHRALGRFRSARWATQNYFPSRTVQHNARLLSRIIQHLSRLMLANTPEFKLYFSPQDTRGFILSTVPNFIHFFSSIAKVDKTFHVAALAADILGLMRPLLVEELVQTELSLSPHEGDLLTVYDASDFATLALLREHGLRKFLPESSLPQLDESMNSTVYRTYVLCMAFSVFRCHTDNQIVE